MLKKLMIFLVLVALVGAGFYFALLRNKEETNVLVLYGNVDVRQVDLGFQVRGRVEKMFFEEGDEVPPGALLASLDKTPYIDQVRQSEANREAIRVNYQNAEKLFQRRLDLVSSGAISREDLENTDASKKALGANLKQAEASLDIAKTNLQYTDIYAPIEGVILTRVREPGTVVTETDPVYTLSITSPVWVRTFVSEPQLGLIYPGMPADIYTDTPHGKVYHGKIGFISPIAEFTPKTVETTQLRTDLVYRLRIYVDNSDRGLRQGMPVTVRLPLEQHVTQVKQ